MKAWLAPLVLCTLVAVAAPAAADAGASKEYCTPYLDFIHPSPPVVCVGYQYGGVNDFCAHVEDDEECVQFVGPVIW